jgi:sodium transport system permease protein
VVEIVQLRRPTVRAVAGAVLIGLSAWAVIGMLVEWIAPAPKELVDHLRREIAPADGRRGLVVTLLLMALTPAICEEALFRGPILRGLASQLSPRAAALATGMLFGLFHFDIWRMLPTGLLGVVLSLIALRAGSIVPAMVAHFMNNACLITLAQLRLDDKMADLGRSAQAGMFGAAALVLATGAWLLRGPNQERRQGPE